MVTKRRKKVTKHRGATTHGWGSKKKHRGSGNRGGFGFTGRGKHSDHRKQEYFAQGIFLGKRGFKMHGATKSLRAINLEDIQKNIHTFVKEGKVQKKADIYIVDTNALGYQKVLGTGKLTIKLHITAQEFSEKAADKVQKAG